MNDQRIESEICPKCGWESSAGLVAGLCPRCVLGNVDLLHGDQTASEATRAAGPEETMAYQPTDSSTPLPRVRTPAEIGNSTAAVASAGNLPNIEGYAILSEIGRGGMGVVFRARDLNLGREVALKLVHGSSLSDASLMQRFQAEAEACARLNHPGIVPVYEIGSCHGVPFFTMPLIEGDSLADRLTDGPLSVAESVRLMIAVAAALESAHAAGVIHRDLKPANILIDENGAPHIIDFGLAKVNTATVGLTATGQMLGTPAYMSPEQASGKIESVDERSDVYALGAVLFACLTGRPPFVSDGVFETLRQVLDHDAMAPSQFNDDVNADLDALVIGCLEKLPGRRIPSTAELKDELERFSRGEPMNVRPLGRWATIMRWRRLIRESRQLRLRSRNSLCGYPIVHIAIGSDERGESQTGHAKGWLAIGDRATGFVAMGEYATGIFAYGRRATGAFAVGQVAIGLVTFGALSIGCVSAGGIAIGYVAFGWLAIGWHALGTLACGIFAKGFWSLTWFP